MPEVEIRPALSTDLATLAAIDHTSKTDYVWQMDRNLDTGQLAVNFREIRLPRGIRIEYPHPHDQIVDNWKKAAVVLMAVLANEPVGYVTIHEHKSTKTAWITDLVVAEHDRRQGIASA